MKNETIRKILELHSIPCYEQNGRVYADTMLSGSEIFEEVEDLTGWTRKQLYDWLGY